jgi:hypothetical protein
MNGRHWLSRYWMELAVNKEQRLKHALDLGIKVDDEDKWMLEDYLWHVRHPTVT